MLLCQLRHSLCAFSGEHVHNIKIIHTISINIRHIDPHRRATGVAYFITIQSIECSISVIDPYPVRCGVIRTDVNIGRSILIQITQHDCQTPIPRGLHWFSIRRVKSSFSVLYCLELSFTVVQINTIRLRQFAEATFF